MEKENNQILPKIGLAVKLRNYFLTGILVTAPAGFTIYFAIIFINYIDNKITPFIPENLNPETYLPISLPGLGLIVLVVFLILMGMFAAGVVGRFFMKMGERILEKTPFLSGVYAVLKQIMETVLSNKSTSFKKAVLVEYPRKGIFVIGFVAADAKGEVKKMTKNILKTDENKILSIFVPTTPNPTSGFLVFMPESEVCYLNMSVENALKLVISGGIVNPDGKEAAE